MKAQKGITQLAALFATVKDLGEMEEFLADLLTPAEREDLLERWRIVDLLLRGNSQRSIRDELSVSISKVTRGSRELQEGTGAFRRIWERLAKNPQKAG